MGGLGSSDLATSGQQGANIDEYVTIDDALEAMTEDEVANFKAEIQEGAFMQQGYQDTDIAGTKTSSGGMIADLSSAILTANPMPSMPSISNVGSAPFSGSINWNAIPGGFQPLPQVVGRKKKLYQLSKFHGGINQKSSPRDIADFECQEATNVTVSQIGRIRLLGTLKSLTGAQDSGLDHPTVMTDTDTTFITSALIGKTIFNITDGSSGVITGNTASAVTVAALAGGSDDSWEASDVYEISDTGLSTDILAAGGNQIPSPGYGLFVFKSAYSLEASPTQGDYTIVAATDGRYVRLKDSTTSTGDYLDIAGAETHVAPTFYAAGNGLYACDANLDHTTSRKAAILVYRKDYDSSGSAADLVTNTWVTGEALINSPTYDTSPTDGKVNLEWDDGTVSFTATTVAGACIVHIGSSGTGNWSGDYYIYISWLFDNGCETGLCALVTTGASAPNGPFTFADEQLSFNFSVKDNNSTRNHIGGDARIHGARIYFRKSGTVERFLLAEVSLQDGIKGALDSTFTPWDENDTDAFDLASNIVFESPPEIYTYVALNGYYANETYDRSPDTRVDGTGTSEGPIAHDVRYRTATVAANGAVFIGNYMFRNKVFADGMMYSMPNKPGLFPEYNVFDSPSSDGTPITALMSFQDKVIQFKQDAMYVINISNPSKFYTQASFRNCGIMNPCQAFHTPFGIIFVNVHGCFVYDGRKVISLTSGKLTSANWGISEGSVVDTAAGGKDAVSVPCIGYDPRSQSIVVLKNIGDNADSTADTGEGAWVYNMSTQSWTEGSDMITNSNVIRHSNFIVSPNGYLSIVQYGNSPHEVLKNYDIAGVDASTSQTITYWTKDLDFGLPSQTKKVFKVYITYKGDADSLVVKYGVDGETDTGDLFTFHDTSADNSSSGASDGNATPLRDKNSAGDLESWHVAELVPTTASEATGIKSISIYMNGAVDETFEINDISILYRARPIK